MENELKSKIKLLEATLAFMDQGVIVFDNDLTIVASNARAADLRDIPAEMLDVGKSFEHIIRHFAKRGDYGSGDLEEMFKRDLALARSRQPIRFERTRPDGKVLEVRASPMPGGGNVVTFTDITERKKAEEAIVEGKQNLDLMLENVVDGLIAIEKNGIVRVFNATAQRIFGYSKDEVVGNNISMLMPEPYRSRHDSYLSDYHRTNRPQLIGSGREVVGRRKDGSEFPLELGIGEVTAGGRRIYIGTVRDLTDKKVMENQLRQSQKMESLGTLAGGIAHDFNNLLTSILGYTKLVKKRLAKDDTSQSYLDSVLETGSRASELVEQITTFSSVDKPQRVPVLICGVVADALKLIHRTLPASVIVEEDVEENAGIVLLNETEIHQIVINLAGNAADAMDGTGALTVALRRVAIDDDMAMLVPELSVGAYVNLTVRDEGCGMDDETQRRIFDPFYSTKEVGLGTGLGLSVVHGIVNSYDGAIIVTSAPGEGTSFELFFPCVGDPAIGRTEDQGEVGSPQ